jgi:hypothetical protein
MTGSSNLTLFLIGLAIGITVALAGGLIDYGLHLRRNREPTFGVPGCLVYVVGGLILVGVVALIASLILTGGVGAALIMGAGVMVGFYSGFILLVGLWFWHDSLRQPTEKSMPSDSTVP